MPLPVIWSPRAQDKYLEILAYWHENALDYALKLDDAVESLLRNLGQFKDFCPPSIKHPRYRKCVIIRRYSLIYRNDMDMIWIVDLLDNRGRHGF